MAHVSRWLRAADLDVADLPRWTQQFLRTRLDAGYQHHLTDRALRPLLAYLQDQGRDLRDPLIFIRSQQNEPFP